MDVILETEHVDIFLGGEFSGCLVHNGVTVLSGFAQLLLLIFILVIIIFIILHQLQHPI